MKNYTISLRVSDLTLKQIESLKKRCNMHSKPINSSEVIICAIDLACKLNLENMDTFLVLFGQCAPNTFHNEEGKGYLIVKK